MKKRVLFVINSLWGGGAEKVFQTLLCNLDKNKYDITVYSVNQTHIGPPYPMSGIEYRYIFGQLAKTGLERFKMRLMNKLKLTVYYHLSPKWFYRMFMRGRYDVEVAFIEGYATRVVSGSTNKRSKKLAWVHIDLEKNHWTDVAYRSRKEEEAAYNRFDLIPVVSQSVHASMKSLFKKIETFLVVKNPIDERFICSQSVVFKAKLPSAAIKLVSIGRFENQKGYDRLLPIVRRLVDEGYDLSLTLLGDGSQRKSLELYINGNGLSERVSLPGFQSNPYPWLAGADLFVCSSRSEGYSTVVTEALILGLPVITTDCAGMGELLGCGRYGMIVDNDDEALYNGLKSLVVNPEKIDEYRNLASERGKDFKLSALMSQIETLID